MNKTLPLAALLSASLALTACSSLIDAPSSPSESPTPAAQAPAPLPDQGLPADTLPEVPRDSQEPCPYLDTAFVADTNGQRMTSQGVDHRFDTPACVFWSYPEEPQATVIVRHMPTEQDAIAVVDWAAPIDTTDPAEEPAGWSGGRSGGEAGAVYAVQKGTTAVVVFSNQGQSLKAQLLAEATIANLGL